MGQTKTFAFWLAGLIFERKMTNEEIIAAVAKLWNEPPDRVWLLEQVKYIREHPEDFKPGVTDINFTLGV